MRSLVQQKTRRITFSECYHRSVFQNCAFWRLCICQINTAVETKFFQTHGIGQGDEMPQKEDEAPGPEQLGFQSHKLWCYLMFAELTRLICYMSVRLHSSTAGKPKLPSPWTPKC